MTIRIVRNDAGNCINFIGSSMPAYFNACLSGEVHPEDSNAINVINDIQSAAQGETRYEFYQIPYTQFSDKDGAVFANAQEAADYITQEGNVIGVSDVGADLIGVDVNFRHDPTSTSIIMDNGSAFGVNTIKAVADTDGTIHIHAIGGGIPSGQDEPNDHKHFEHLEHTRVSINGVAVSGGLQDVVNALNELFTVGPFESVVIADPYSTMVADVDGTTATMSILGTHGIDPVGNDVFGTSTSGNYNGYKSTETIDQAGEYFTFDIRNEGQIGFGLVISDAAFAAGSYPAGSNTTYLDPSTFGVGNSAHYGFQFSHWFHPTPNGSWTNYGALTGYVQGPGWYAANTQFEARDEWLAGTPIKMRVGIDENGFISISSLKDDGTTWVVHARTSYPVPEGFEAHLGIKVANSTPRVYSVPKVHLLEPAAPVLNFRYIESPDGYYSFPLFATQEEADYYEEQVSGSANGSHTHVYPDDPSQTTWYMPATSNQMNYGLDPVTDGVTTFLGNPINWTEITSLTNSDLAPPAYTDTTIAVDENSSVNIQTQPQDTGYTTTMTGLPLGLFHLGDGTVIGTAPEVTSDNVANPSDDYTVTVTRTNNYGSSTGTLTITVNNLTAPDVAPIAGFTHEAASTALVDSDTMDDGSVVAIDNILDDGNRLVINKAFVDNQVLPAITAASGDKSVWIGFARESGAVPSWSSVDSADFEAAFEFFCNDVERANGTWRLRVYVQGTQVLNVGIGSSSTGLYNYLFINDSGEIKIGGLLPSYGDATSFVWDAGAVSWEQVVGSLATQNRSIYIATDGCQMDLTTSEFHEVVEPSTPTTLTSWSKAIDFSGNAERMQIVDNSYYRVPMKMAGLNNQVAAPGATTHTSADSNARPWATAIVFKVDGHNSNQHIWNVGEGTGTTDDNIYLRLSSDRNLYFGWGRDGDRAEVFVADISGSISGWHAVYIAHNGARYGANNTTSLMADAFDIRYTRGNLSWAVGTNVSTSSNWTITGDGRMNRSYDGYYTLGGRGANRSFHGKIASMVSTTLRRNVPMPSDAEIAEMITDPMGWLSDYKVGNAFRLPWQSGDASWNFALNDGSSGYATQVWLMGDGAMDSYSNMIRNQVVPSDQNYTKMNMISMVSNDIQNVTIAGLS